MRMDDVITQVNKMIDEFEQSVLNHPDVVNGIIEPSETRSALRSTFTTGVMAGLGSVVEKIEDEDTIHAKDLLLWMASFGMVLHNREIARESLN